MKRIKQKQRDTSQEIEAVEYQLIEDSKKKEKIESIAHRIAHIKGSIDYFDDEDKRAFLRAILHKVIVHPDLSIDIIGAFDLPKHPHFKLPVSAYSLLDKKELDTNRPPSSIEDSFRVEFNLKIKPPRC